jgi:hypothetical protein
VVVPSVVARADMPRAAAPTARTYLMR